MAGAHVHSSGGDTRQACFQDLRCNTRLPENAAAGWTQGAMRWWQNVFAQRLIRSEETFDVATPPPSGGLRLERCGILRAGPGYNKVRDWTRQPARRTGA